MNDYTLYFSLYVGAFLLSVMGLWFTIIVTGIDRFSKRFFMSYFFIFMLCCLSSIFETAFQYYIVPRAVYFFMLLFIILLLSLPLPMMTIYLLHCCGENIRTSRLFHAVLALWALYSILLVNVPFIDEFIYVTPENQFYRGSLYSFFQIPIITVLLLNLAGTVRRRTHFSRKAFLSFVIAQVPIAITLTVNLFVDAVALFDISYVLSALAMYSLILSDQIEQDKRRQQKIISQEREIANQRASVMVLQMRPHFIYNALISIYGLCRLDPEKARQTTLDFANYLRKNFSAIVSDSAIPFSTELEHTRAYLAVEQVQHDDMLVVDWDTGFTNFRLPPLTLQPIVENAVKHGMDTDSAPLRILIRTKHTDFGTEITVEDTGPGFDPSDESKPHTTLENIRQRLEMMCGGSMSIKPREGGGAVVTIMIPDST